MHAPLLIQFWQNFKGRFLGSTNAMWTKTTTIATTKTKFHLTRLAKSNSDLRLQCFGEMWRMYVLLLIRTQPNLEVGLARLYPNLNELKRKILPKIILDSALSDHNYFWTLIFRIKIFYLNFFQLTFLWTKLFSLITVFWSSIFLYEKFFKVKTI